MHKYAIVKLQSKRQTGLGTSLATAIRSRVKTEEKDSKGKPIYRKDPIPWGDLEAAAVTEQVIANLQLLVPGATKPECKAIVWRTMLEQTNEDIASLPKSRRAVTT